MKTRLLTVIIVMVVGSSVMVFADVVLQLKYQINNDLNPDNYVCWNSEHLLVERPNGKFACITPYMMIKLNWQPYKHEYYIFDVLKDNSVYAVFALDSNAVVSEIRYDVDLHSLIVDMPRNNSGKLFIEIPRDLLDAKLVRCDEVSEDPSDWDFFVLVDGEEVAFEEVFTTDDYRALEILYKKNSKQIEIVDACLI
ncbi:hypothetical protein NZNM25_07910 [Nitrosopumilus zosterae]|uniref:Uncharacterized protein n=1 Tax=Nitrosopumilus zosterae TaxID=718286 RepID=A0A2S2KQN9_9ARCH|nr:hypothetical protein [Nitrosopumilus zosterae]BDQ30568.1 hypothetical protein NZOSNM25_000673 [Nitrosopumilus zosterae]GBH34000.1 hypothetical protein NZNM25_07910 [Nitrosopumilus zosterae]